MTLLACYENVILIVVRILLSMADPAMPHNSWHFVKGFLASDDLVSFQNALFLLCKAQW